MYTVIRLWDWAQSKRYILVNPETKVPQISQTSTQTTQDPGDASEAIVKYTRGWGRTGKKASVANLIEAQGEQVLEWLMY